jgi:hypothetical protein
MKLSTRKQLKLAAYWAAFFVLATALTIAASLIGAELAGASSQEGWALAKVASLVTSCLSLLGYVVQQIEG